MKSVKVLILGGGSGGICAAARLRKAFPSGVAILEPSPDHFYQPLWTLVGAGLVKKEKTRRAQRDLIPRGVEWIQDAVQSVDPIAKQVTTRGGKIVGYDWLVVATGLQLDFDRIAGLPAHGSDPFIHSIYRYEGAESLAGALESFRGGRAIFTMPPVPIKCAGAPQKIMYLAEEIFRRNGVRDQTEIVFATAGKVIFGVPEFAKPLMEVAARKGIQLRFAHRLTRVDAQARCAYFETEQGEVGLDYDLLHVVPPMSAHAYVKESGLAWSSGSQAGWLEVHPATLQHPRYPEVFGIGDVTGVPNSKTGAAIRKQAPVVAANLLAVSRGHLPVAAYDGYSSCPLVTGVGKVILAEFGYEGKLLPSFPWDATKERWSMWILKRFLLPPMYWRGMLTGRL